MYIQANKATCEAISQILLEQQDKPQNVRVFMAGMS